MTGNKAGGSRVDYRIITDLVEQRAQVLDLGCGSGELLQMLNKEKHVQGQGVEISEQGISQCLARGVQAIQGDIDQGLADYQDGTFDYVILNQTLQVVRKPDLVLREMVRVGKRGIVGFPNFGHYRIRAKLLLSGRMPRTPELPFEWYDTPNIHLLSIRDFELYAQANGIEILTKIYLKNGDRLKPGLRPNLFAKTALYVIRHKG